MFPWSCITSRHKNNYNRVKHKPQMGTVFFTRKYVDFLVHNAGQFFAIPLGNSKQEKAPRYLSTDVDICYYQGEKNYCLVYSVASALKYMGFHENRINKYLRRCAEEVSNMSMTKGIDKVVETLGECFHELGRPQKYNQRNASKKMREPLTWEELIQRPLPYLTIVVPVGKDGCRNHAIAIIDNIIFDASR